MAKMNRERAVKERRALKAEKKQAKKDAAAGLNTEAEDSTSEEDDAVDETRAD